MREIDRFLAKVPFAPVVAAMFAAVAVLLISATPQWLFERWMSLSGVADLIPAATPPLGDKARIAAALVAGVATGALVWLGLIAAGRLIHNRPAYGDLDETTELPSPHTRRRPLFAGNELGAPLMSDEAMAQARDELVLDIPIQEEAAQEPLPADDPIPGHHDVEDADLVPAAAEGRPNVQKDMPVSLHPRLFEERSIAALLGRLDAAIASKPEGFRPDRSDMVRLRSALGR